MTMGSSPEREEMGREKWSRAATASCALWRGGRGWHGGRSGARPRYFILPCTFSVATVSKRSKEKREKRKEERIGKMKKEK
jgi:hypothetical protein